jgi:NAD(P)-dependent dehydrogenase (short-subunit alcohol dehydrogenase family)|tara:strand:+ start:417 stop:1169 length:753 start_codon:yes stop_codon:yes gene_type:complete
LFELDGKRVLVTGASSGIGARISELFSDCGAIVGIHYHGNEKGATEVLSGIKENSGKAGLFRGDLLDSSARSMLVQSFVDKYGGIDVLINNAGGVYGNAHFLKMDEDSWNKTFALNVTAPFFLAKNAFSYMQKEGSGKIINISSISAKYGGSPTTMHYGAAKAALDAITSGLARAGAPYNILVNSIRGGVIDTPFHEKITRDKKILEKRIMLIPLKRMGKPVDIARMALFLASDAGDYITGEIFTVAGGD